MTCKSQRIHQALLKSSRGSGFSTGLLSPFKNRQRRATFQPSTLIYWLFHALRPPPELGGYFWTARQTSRVAPWPQCRRKFSR